MSEKGLVIVRMMEEMIFNRLAASEPLEESEIIFLRTTSSAIINYHAECLIRKNGKNIVCMNKDLEK